MRWRCTRGDRFAGTAWLATLIRTVVRGFAIISGSTPIAVYDDVESAVRGLEAVLGAAGSDVAHELLQAFAKLRGQRL